MKYFIAGLFLLFSSSVYSQTTITIPVVFKDTGPQGQDFVLTFGIDSRATDCIDTALDERDLPPPPPGFLPVILPGCLDSNAGTPISLHKDYRAIPPDSTIFSKTYRCLIYRGENRQPVNLRWDNNLPSGVDSAAILIEFVDTVNMRAQSEYVLDNQFVTELYIRVYYHLTTVGVAEDNISRHISLFPLPAEDNISVKAEGYEGGTYELYSIEGNRLQTGTIHYPEFRLATGNLPAGVYLLQLYDARGRSRLMRFVRQ
jgi:hypothetical protein